MLRILKLLWLVVFVCAIGWALANSIVVVNAIVKSSGAKGYREALFVVKDVEYHPERTETRRGKRHWTPACWWANGSVDARTERYSLEGVLSRVPQSQRDLEKMVSVGQEFRILYNSDMPSTVIQGETLRVLPLTTDLSGEARSIVRRYLLYCLLPVAVLLLPWPVRCLLKRKPKKLPTTESSTIS